MKGRQKMTSKEAISEITQALFDAEKKGIIGLTKSKETDLNVSPQWRKFFSEIGGFVLNNSGEEFWFQESFKTVNYLMPRRIDLSGSTRWGWFCRVNQDGNPCSVWFQSDCFCCYGFASFDLWVKAILTNHQTWMDFWVQNGSPDRELDEEKWEQVLAKFDPQQLELGITRQCSKRTIIYRDEVRDFTQAKFGDYLDFRCNLSAVGDDDLYRCGRHSLLQKLKLFLFP